MTLQPNADSDFFQLDPAKNELIISFWKKTNSAKILIFEV